MMTSLSRIVGACCQEQMSAEFLRSSKEYERALLTALGEPQTPKHRSSSIHPSVTGALSGQSACCSYGPTGN